ncbi:MAG: hypothetical protein KIT80_02180 [Chitinophagaceae bacterium]|nr:hypothetical protein [Chitinophagaceae bacterium]MCW5925693.1 hypothetical protein [Chitinophagaceae bacterium]
MITSSRKLWMFCWMFMMIMACNTETKSPPAQTYFNENGRNDSWGYVGYGGGGAMFYPAVSPFDPDFAFVACDMTGSYVTYDGGEKWRMFNLGNPVSFFAFDPHDSNTVYANSEALYKSTDKGKTWKIFYPAEQDVAAIISKGDHAANVVVTKDSISRRLHAFAVDPANPEQLYAGVTIDRANGIYSSADGGKQWKLELETAIPIKNIFTTPAYANERVWYAATAGGIYVKKEGNWSFNKIPSGVKSFTTISAGYDSIRQKMLIYAISGKSYFNNAGDSSGIFFSADGGATWQNRQSGVTDFCNGCTPEWRTIAASAGNGKTVYVSYNDLKKGDTTSIGVAKSEDYGVSWSLVWEDRLFNGGSSVSANFNSGWLNERFDPSWGENPFSIGVSPTDPGVCYATDFGRTVKTSDGGTTWEQVYTKKSDNGWSSRGLEVTTSYDIVMDPFDSAHFFICNTDVGLMESRDGGRSWKSATMDNGIPRSWINSTYWLVFDPEVKDRAWAVMSGTHDLPRPKMWRRNGVAGYRGGILVTNDGGKNWQPLSAEIGEAAFTHILLDTESGKDRRVLYACAFGKGVYKSEDGGKTWKQKNNGLPAKEPFAWRITRRNRDGALFLVVSRRGEGVAASGGDGGLYLSKDGAETWTKINLPEGTNAPTDIMTDAEEPDRLILSAWGKATPGAFSPDTGGGIFISDDEGKTWKQTMQKDQHIHDITYDVRIKTYYACGFNSSAYRSTDHGNTWNRIRGYNFKWGKRVVPDPRDVNRIFIITFGGGVWYGPAEGDTTAIEDIVSNF